MYKLIMAFAPSIMLILFMVFVVIDKDVRQFKAEDAAIKFILENYILPKNKWDCTVSVCYRSQGDE